MAGKALPQALSLVHREAPLVQTADSTGRPFVKSLAAIFSAKAKNNGKVTKVSHDSIELLYEDGTKDKIKLTKNLPFNQKGFLDTEEPLVKVGDKVTKGQILADNNYTKKGDLALGLNLNVAYMPYKGLI
jgi:DNA-directed RNA polymerase subunit beta